MRLGDFILEEAIIRELRRALVWTGTRSAPPQRSQRGGRPMGAAHAEHRHNRPRPQWLDIRETDHGRVRAHLHGRERC